MSGQRRVENARGLHVLMPAVAADLVRSAEVGTGELVLDLGAGTGALTSPLAKTGADVLAVERSPRLARRLDRRYADTPAVRVLQADMRDLRLPRRPYRVVANLPFSIVMTVLGRLLDDPSTLRRADLVVPWHVAVRLARRDQGQRRVRRWHRRYSFTISRRLPPGAFRPPPSVAAAVLVVRRHGRRVS